ncbi:hypothetical protein ON010_g16467 [Phytophthora cinnamomi]|nr:hypothetical protein ON010_g16467 [Phytophthora cinnamomi]
MYHTSVLAPRARTSAFKLKNIQHTDGFKTIRDGGEEYDKIHEVSSTEHRAPMASKSDDIEIKSGQTTDQDRSHSAGKAIECDVLQCSAEPMRSALNAAINLEEIGTAGANDLQSFLATVAETSHTLTGAHEVKPAKTKQHLEDMRLLVSVTVVNLKRGMTKEEIRFT